MVQEHPERLLRIFLVRFPLQLVGMPSEIDVQLVLSECAVEARMM